MAYTVEITDASGSYTFGVDRAPAWGVATEAEYDTAKTPAVLIRTTETLTLRGCSFRSSTPANVTTDWATLQQHLFDRATPIVSVQLKDGAQVIEELATATVGGDHHSLLVERLEPDVEPGFFATHWKGTIVVRGVRSRGDADGVVRKVRSLHYAFDQHGFETRTLSVTIETLTGTSAKGKVEAEALELPTDRWFTVTNGPSGVEITQEDEDEDTRAQGRCQIREQALALPSGANEYAVDVVTEESGDESEVRYEISAQADTLNRALQLVRRSPAPTGYARKVTREERARNRVSASYVVRGDRKLRVKSWRLAASGGGREREAIRFPSIGGERPPIAFRRPRDVFTFTEEVTVRQRGNPNPAAPSVFVDSDDLETHVSRDSVALVEQGSAASQSVWERSVTRTHVFFERPPAAGELLARLLTHPIGATEEAWAYELAEASHA